MSKAVDQAKDCKERKSTLQKGNGRLFNGLRSRRVSTAKVPEAAAKELEEKKKKLRQDSTVHKRKQGRNREGDRNGGGASQQIKGIDGRYRRTRGVCSGTRPPTVASAVTHVPTRPALTQIGAGERGSPLLDAQHLPCAGSVDGARFETRGWAGGPEGRSRGEGRAGEEALWCAVLCRAGEGASRGRRIAPASAVLVVFCGVCAKRPQGRDHPRVVQSAAADGVPFAQHPGVPGENRTFPASRQDSFLK
ncbi:hypothetical protein TgHK011_000606 [Trichoderma gracile]|nr:hypothetical protein TgHK011_000606 [Trichoderma gracile]